MTETSSGVFNLAKIRTSVRSISAHLVLRGMEWSLCPRRGFRSVLSHSAGSMQQW